MANFRKTTADLLAVGDTVEVLLGGACEYVQIIKGEQARNATRDEFAEWLDARNISNADVQISEEVHGRLYEWEIDGPAEKFAIEHAGIRILQIIPGAISTITFMEILSLVVAADRPTIIWFYGQKTFSPEGLGDRNQVLNNHSLKNEVGEIIHSHLALYANAGRQMRNELIPLMDVMNERIRRNFGTEDFDWRNHITIAEGDTEAVKSAINSVLGR